MKFVQASLWLLQGAFALFNVAAEEGTVLTRTLEEKGTLEAFDSGEKGRMLYGTRKDRFLRGDKEGKGSKKGISKKNEKCKRRKKRGKRKKWRKKRGRKVTDFRVVLTDITSIPPATTFGGTTFGGISGITYNRRKNEYYAISDNGDGADARFYTLEIDEKAQPPVNITNVTFLTDKKGVILDPSVADTEGIAYNEKRNTIFISSDGDASKGLPPYACEFRLDGTRIRCLDIPSYYNPPKDGSESSGVRDNNGFESATLSPNGKTLWVATENALVQDGPGSTNTTESPSRMLQLDVCSGEAIREAVYVVDPIPRDPQGQFAVNGLSELVALDNHGSFIAIERAVIIAEDNYDIRLYNVHVQDATDTLGWPSLEVKGVPDKVAQKEVFFESWPVPIDNLEGMTFIPDKYDRSKGKLVLVSDDNFFFARQFNLFIVLELTLETVSLM